MREVYDLGFLKGKGFFEPEEKIREHYSSNKEIQYRFDPDNRMGLVSMVEELRIIEKWECFYKNWHKDGISSFHLTFYTVPKNLDM